MPCGTLFVHCVSLLSVLNRIKHVIPVSKAPLNYIKKYQLELQKVIKEAIERDSNGFIMSADNKNKRLWQLINKGTCTSWNKNNNIKIKSGSKITAAPQQIADDFNAFSIDTIRDLKWEKNLVKEKESLQDHMTYNQNSVFVSPVTENKVKLVIQGFSLSWVL